MISSYQYLLNDYECGLLYDIQDYKILLMEKASRIGNESIMGIKDRDEDLIKLGEILYEDFNHLHTVLNSIIQNFYNSNEKNYTKKSIDEINISNLNISLGEDEIKNLYKREK